MPYSEPIKKFMNVARILEKRLGITVPTPISIRKARSTAAAKNLGESETRVIHQQLIHDAQVSANYYELISGNKDAFLTMDDLRKGREAAGAREKKKATSTPNMSLS